MRLGASVSARMLLPPCSALLRMQKNAQAGEVSKRDTIIGHHLVDAWNADKESVDCADGKRRELVPFFETVVDPWSYTQTVENFFYLSCRVKMGVRRGPACVTAA